MTIVIGLLSVLALGYGVIAVIDALYWIDRAHYADRDVEEQ